MNTRDLVNDWIMYQKIPRDSQESEEYVWASNELIRMHWEKPVETWEVILKILSATDDEWVLTNLACGPIEDLLATHGERALEMVEQEIPRNPKLKQFLVNVWQNQMSDQVWERLSALVKRV